MFYAVTLHFKKNAVHAPHPCFIRNPTGIIIHNFPIYSNSHAEYMCMMPIIDG